MFKPVLAILVCCAFISQVAANNLRVPSRTAGSNAQRRIFRRSVMDMPMNMASAGADMFSEAVGTMADGAKDMASMGAEAMSGAVDQMSEMGPPMGGPMNGPMGGPPRGPPPMGHRPYHQKHH